MRTPFIFRHQKSQNTKPLRLLSAMSRRAFQLRVDPLTGTSEWVVVEDGPSDETPGRNSPKFLLANTSYLDMLNDSSRNNAFHQAIKTTVAGPSRVLDIGAGTGLLSMMAVRAMEQNGGGGGTVTAFESYLPMGKLLRKVLRANGFENRVKVVHKRSDEVGVGVDIDRRANVLVSEILDSELLGEGLIPTLQHAHDVLLVENPRTVPFRATIYGQLVESTFLWKLHDLYSCEVEASDEIHLAPSQQDIRISVGLKQHAMHCSPLLKEIKLLSEPFGIFEFEFSRRPASQRTVDLDIKTSNDGTAHAIVSWWVLQLDSTGSVFYSTAPQWSQLCDSAGPASYTSAESKNWCDHWKQCVWFIPGNGIPVSKGDSAACEAIQDITSISFRMKNYTKAEMPTLAVRDSQILLPPERIGIYGDKCWRRSFITAARNALQQKDSPFCLITDDSLFLSIAIAHLSKTAHIVSAFPGLQEKASLYLESVASENDFSNGRIQVLGRKASCLTADDFRGRKIDLYIAEPFYYGNEGALPWQNLRFWKERTLVDPFLSKGALIMPSKGLLKACAMSLPDLWKSRRSLKKIEGFDHSSLDEILGACGDIPATTEAPCLPYFVWQCGIVEKLSEVFSIMEFDFSELIHPCFERTTITFTKPGVCHGFVLWIDWVIDEKNSILISTGPDSRYWKQGVKLLRKPFAVNAPSSCGLNELGSSEIEASFNPLSGELDVRCHT